MLPLELLLMLVLINDRLRLHKKLLNYVHKRLRKSLRTPQRSSNCTWKSCVQSNKKSPSAMKRSNSWKL
ncbi:hypothetical protein ACOSQ2_013976 [Xanthoceras sorbifolium]